MKQYGTGLFALVDNVRGLVFLPCILIVWIALSKFLLIKFRQNTKVKKLQTFIVSAFLQ